MRRLVTTTPSAPNADFARLASEDRIRTVVAALERNGIKTSVVDTGGEACRHVLEMLPDDAEVFTSTSTTLDTLGLTAAIDGASRLRPLRPRLAAMDRDTQAGEIRRLRAGPDFIVGSVHAITEDGQLLIASA
jgi:hypothetical protein